MSRKPNKSNTNVKRIYGAAAAIYFALQPYTLRLDPAKAAPAKHVKKGRKINKKIAQIASTMGPGPKVHTACILHAQHSHTL